MKKKALFIDRDGTIIVEPPEDFQIDSLEKLEFIPGAITYLQKIAAGLDYDLVMVTNQDGLGTESFPEDTFWPAHNKMMLTLANEGIVFKEVLIDRSLEHEQKPTRKPGTGMLTHYMQGEYDMAQSFVIGDRVTDVLLAENLGAKAILFNNPAQCQVALRTRSWAEIWQFLKGQQERTARVVRKTTETHVVISLDLDRYTEPHIQTGIGFFDHMLHQLARHGRLGLHIAVQGDLHIDEHHTIEDTGLALGQAFSQALGDKRGIERYGFAILPMDEALAQVAIDFSGRPWMVWEAAFKREKVGQMPTEMFSHFFKSFSDTALCNLNIKVEGSNEHHQIEIIFKAFARAIRMAIRREDGNQEIPSTKGVL